MTSTKQFPSLKTISDRHRVKQEVVRHASNLALGVFKPGPACLNFDVGPSGLTFERFVELEKSITPEQKAAVLELYMAARKFGNAF